MRYGEYLKELLDGSSLSKTKLCATIGVSRPYLYAVFSGATPPPVPSKQLAIANLLPATNEQKSILFDLAANERNEMPADILACVKDKRFIQEVRENYVYPQNGTSKHQSSISKSVHRPLRVPCCYQGGKQRIAAEIVSIILDNDQSVSPNAKFYDLCCGSGAFTIELLNRGVAPAQITMLDKSSWGKFWSDIAAGHFDIERFHALLSKIPKDKRLIRDYMSRLSEMDIADEEESYVYIMLQACSFGGKQIWRDGNIWRNAFFRNYWEPTTTSVRRSPANPMQPSPENLEKRIAALVSSCKGITCLHSDIYSLLNENIPENSIIYIDPPYQNATGYAFGFDVMDFVERLKDKTAAHIYISEAVPLTESAVHLNYGGANGGISGYRAKKHQEWLSKIA